MKRLPTFCIIALICASTVALAAPLPFTSDFRLYETGLRSTSRNPFFSLTPGYQLVLEGGDTRLVVLATQHTKGIHGVNTRIVVETETENGRLVEISRNYFAASDVNNSVFYFGEDVDIFDPDGTVTHEGAWRAGSNGAREGLIMAGIVLVGARYFEEVAPGVALDRAEIVSVTETLTVPAGTFHNVIKVKETTPLEPGAVEFKWYAPGVGLIRDDTLELVSYGRIF